MADSVWDSLAVLEQPKRKAKDGGNEEIKEGRDLAEGECDPSMNRMVRGDSEE